MYADRSFVRDKPIKLRANEHSKRLIEAAAAYIGKQPSTWGYELLMAEVEKVLHEAQLATPEQELRRSK